MAFSFRELPWYLQALVYLLLLVVLVAVGEYAPYSPVQSKRQELERTQTEVSTLTQEVALLQDVQRRHSQFRTETEALQRQLDTLRAIVPEEKEVDEFIRILQSAAAASNVSIRRITAKPVTPRDYYNEMPFELEIDGPYFAVLDFFTRLGRISRIVNVGDLSFQGLETARTKRYPVRPGTTVTGIVTATTFFTQGAEAAAATPPAATQPGKRPAAKQPAKR
ncbi:MAG: type 4a pilus biogenesis protein PilO [Firmicutes bacterium]|nr:type 4a pilus biogenesis protein PilO [Bacillota bacterium]